MPRLPRRFALPLSLTLTVFIAFAVASFASKAGWLQAQSDNSDVVSAEAPAEPSPTADLSTPESLIVTDYVYQDIPVYVTREAAPAATKTAAPEPTPFIQQAQVVSSSSDGSDNNNDTNTSFSSTSSNTAVSQVDQKPPAELSWSHDGDGDDKENFEDEHQDEHHETEHEHEGDD
jgi:hypothetical protein